MDKVIYKGGVNVRTEPGNALSTEGTVGHLVLSNGTRVQVKRAFVTAASNDTTELLPANATVLYRVLSCFMLAGSVAADVTFKSDTTAITPPLTNAANGGAVLPLNIYGWMQTLEIGDPLNVTVSNSSAVGVIINFIELTDDLYDLL